jgi:hypothetical protein
MSEEPNWLSFEQVLAMHSRQLRRFGERQACGTRVYCAQRSNGP